MDSSKIKLIFDVIFGLFGYNSGKNAFDCWREIKELENRVDEESLLKRKKAKNNFRLNLCLTAIFVLLLIGVLVFEPPEKKEYDTSEPNTSINNSVPNQNNTPSDTIIIDSNDLETVEIGDEHVFSNGVYTGSIDSEGLPNGYGTMNYNNLDEYSGEWLHGKMHGTGIMKYANGDIYEGDWYNNKKQGEGKYTWKDGKTYEGEYKDDKRFHKGKYTGWSGSIYNGEIWEGEYIGEHVNDVFQGFGSFIISNGDTFEGIFEKGQIWNGIYTKNGVDIEIVDGRPTS